MNEKFKLFVSGIAGIEEGWLERILTVRYDFTPYSSERVDGRSSDSNNVFLIFSQLDQLLRCYDPHLRLRSSSTVIQKQYYVVSRPSMG
jgi:hypothetical protein